TRRAHSDKAGRSSLLWRCADYKVSLAEGNGALPCNTRPVTGCFVERLNLRIKIEERFHARAQLLFDLFLAALEQMHGDVRFALVLQLDRRLAELLNVVRGQQPHAIDQRQLRHPKILSLRTALALLRSKTQKARSRCDLVPA